MWQLKESPNLYCNTLQVRFSIACSLVARERDMTGSLPSGFHAGGESLAPPTSRRRGASVEAPTDEYSYGAVVRPAAYGRPKKMRKTLSGTLAHTHTHIHTHSTLITPSLHTHSTHPHRCSGYNGGGGCSCGDTSLVSGVGGGPSQSQQIQERQHGNIIDKQTTYKISILVSWAHCNYYKVNDRPLNYVHV